MNLLIFENLLIWIWFCQQMDLGFVVIVKSIIDKPMTITNGVQTQMDFFV